MLKLLQKLEKLFQRLWRGENIKQAKHPYVFILMLVVPNGKSDYRNSRVRPMQVCLWQRLWVLVTREVMGDYTTGGYGCL
jgi:hypothetical protein